MKKVEHIEKYGIEAYEKKRQKGREWKEENPEKVKASNQEVHRKGGKYYQHTIGHMMSGLPHERKKVRGRHQNLFRPYKQIIAPESQIHHEWMAETANYRGVALVEKKQHQYGFIDVIQILEGKITLLTEAEIRMDGAK